MSGKSRLVIIWGAVLLLLLAPPLVLPLKPGLAPWADTATEANTAPPPVRKHYNRLAAEKSPYLLQHADNPIFWYPWGEAAFKAAREEDKPIFLSIGYSTCHWCHVLEKESFEDRQVADVLNEGFICIKVDREEHPDVDKIYMDAVQAMTGSGGWPLTVVMGPDLMPFFGGTYFPKEDLIQILQTLNVAWQKDRVKIAAIGKKVQSYLNSRNVLSAGSITLDEGVLKQAYRRMLARFDPEYGGFGHRPKFPPTMKLGLLGRIARRSGEPKALKMVAETLEYMARGGMYDHLGGGFHRYSTDREWLTPHFEKMLYDQAALARVYLEGFQLTGNPMFEQVARGVLDYVLRDMTGPQGQFYSAEDADSEGVEGKFYVWSLQELKKHLSESEYRRFAAVYDVSGEGNFDLPGQSAANILALKQDADWQARQALASIRRKLLQIRNRRVHPFKDDKTITAWNGLMLGSLAKAYQVLGDEKYLKAARRAARFLQTHLYRSGKLLRRYRQGDAEYPGTLDDYAYLVQGLLTLYEADFDAAWFRWARELQAKQDELLWDGDGWGYFFSEADSNFLPLRKKEFHDNARPSGNGVAVLNLLRLYNFTLDGSYKTKAQNVLKGIGERLTRFPNGYSQMLIALDFYLDRAKQVAVVGDARSPANKTILRAFQTRFLPNKILAFKSSSDSAAALPVLKDKVTAQGKTTVYVCEENVCKYPTSDLDKAIALADDPRHYKL